jgi:threonine dehydrogenase-like Zn-dependent dehydrogenase
MSAVLRPVVNGDVLARAAVFMGNAQARTDEVVVRAPEAGEARVRLEGCGVCASNLPVWQGRPWFKYPFAPGAPGHEGWGVVDAIGEHVSEVRVGDRVAFVSSNAYAEYDIAPATSLVPIPAALAGKPVPGEPLGCAFNIFRRSEIQAGQTVAVIGIGFIGALVTALCVRAGARVIALSRRAQSLEMAGHFGATHRISTEDPTHARREARQLCGEAGFERIIEAVGHQESLDLATDLAGVRARLMIAGYHQESRRSIDMQRWNWLGLDVVNAHERDPAVYAEGIRGALDLIASGELDPTPLYTHRFALDELGNAFRCLESRPPGFMKALIDCNGAGR